MADRTVSVRLTLRNEGFVAGLKQAQRQAGEFSDKLSKGVQDNRSNLDTLAGGFATIGAAAAIGVGAAVKKFADFDQAMSGVQAATHESAGNMDALREAAIRAGKDTAFSATEAATGIENLAKAGVSTKDILGGGLAGALDLAAAGELGVADAAEIAATAMTQFKLSGDQVPHIADLLAAAAGKAQGEVSDMAAALNQSGLVASQMGLSIEETTGTLASFASAGLLGSDAGTSFKTMLLSLANPSKEAAATMKELGIHAYDAQGAFIGIAPLAEQLKTKLGGLSQEQRDATLATIFGSDAIRAASVLYSEGAKGISDWSVKVNDSGFAAETAAIKTDNLKGDIERLGGSIDTALIQAGSGANDALRGLAQGAGLAVDGISNLPDTVQKVGVGLAAVAAVGGLGAAGLLKAANAASEAREAWNALGTTGKRLTLSMGAVGIAITAGLVLYGAFTKKNEEAARKADELRDTLDEQTGAITQNTRSYVANELAQNGLAQKAKDLGLNLATVTDAALGNESALAALVRQLDAVIEAGTLSGAVGNSHKTVLTEEARAAAQLKTDLIGTNEALTDAQKKHKLAAEGATEHKTSQELQAEAVKKANEKIQEQTSSLEEQIQTLHRASSAALTLSGSQIAFESSLDDATASVKENGRTLDINTEKGRQNRSALDDLARAANAETDAMLKSGRSHEATAKNAETSRAAFSRVAQQMGLSKKDADALATSLIDIPDKHDTKVTTSGIKTANDQLSTFARGVNTTLNGIGDEAVKVSLSYVSSLQGGRLGRDPEGFATGGAVFGEGTATSDSIPALLSNGEHVWTAREVQGAGGHEAVKRLRTAAVSGDGHVHGYASGGEVEVHMGTGTPSYKSIAAVASQVARVMGKEIASQVGSAPGGPPGAARNFRGKRLNDRTIAMLLNAERMLGAAFHITQGSYSTSVAASGSTHAGGGAMDTNGPRGWGAAVSALRRAGFAAWHRTPSQGPWGHHIHSIAIGDSSASPAAKRQVQSFLRGGDGLGGMARGGPVKGYRNGGWLMPGDLGKNETSQPELVLNKPQLADLPPAIDYDKLAASMLRAMTTAGVGTMYATIPIDLGHGVKQVVRTEVKTMDREAARSHGIGG